MYDTLVLDNSRRPLDIISAERAVTLCILGKATAIVVWEDQFFHSASLTVAVPKVISLKLYVKIPEYASRVVTNTLLFARDGYTCGYCGRNVHELTKREKLTRDHIKPVSHFTDLPKKSRRTKANDWSNVVTACSTCNGLKSDKTPREAGMKLISEKAPRRPMGVLFTFYEKVKDDEQRKFIDEYMSFLH